MNPSNTMPEQLHVRALILASKGLPLGARSVLAEVCAMCEHGGRGCFDANNRFLAEKLGLTMPKVSAHLHTLERCGLLLISGSGNGERRAIRPTDELRNAYQIDKGLTLTELIRACYNPYRIDKATLTDSVTNHYRIGKHNRKEEEENKFLHGELATLRAAVSELEGRLKKASEQYRADQQAIADLKAENEKLKTEGARPAKVDVVALACPELSFDSFWNAYDKKVGSKPNTLRLWQKLAVGTRRAILNGLGAYRASVSDKQFLPYPESFLNGKMWEAEEYGARPIVPTRAYNQTPTNVAAGVITGSTIPSRNEMMRTDFTPRS